MKGFLNLLGSWTLSIGLMLACGYLWLFFDIGNDLTPPIQAVLWLIFLATAVALITGAMRRKKATVVLQCIALAGVIGLFAHAEIEVYRMREADKPKRIAINEELLASALSALPCSNGDVAVLLENRHAASNFHSKSIWIVPRDRTQIADLLVSAHGKFKPPSDEEVRQYLRWSGTQCGNREYPTLMDLMRHLEAHHVAESPKYRNPAGR